MHIMVKTDCLHYLGDRPCAPHKKGGQHCSDCSQYVKQQGRILIIKLGAAGDVLRTTPLLRKLWIDYPSHKITWITRYPELLLTDSLDVMRFDSEAVMWAESINFDVAINLDKERGACALFNQIRANKKFGFGLDDNGYCEAWNKGALDKINTGLWDDVGKANKLSYQQEIFKICGYEFRGQKYLMKFFEPMFKFADKKIVVGLNTGCGSRWTSRQWPEEYWRDLICKLHRSDYRVILLGGSAEDKMNKRLAWGTDCNYYGHFSLEDFPSLVQSCDIVVTTATLGLHVAIGLGKQVVLLNNIFNPAEFELYGRGEIVEPEQKCTCYFQPECTNMVWLPGEYVKKPCIETLTPEMVLEAVNRQKFLLSLF